MFDGYNRSGSGAVEIERLLCAVVGLDGYLRQGEIKIHGYLGFILPVRVYEMSS